MVADSEGGSDATIYDVARVAGVSPSTVSRTFSRPGRVSAQTAERIRAVADSTRAAQQPASAVPMPGQPPAGTTPTPATPDTTAKRP